ncbi:MAG TPA: putative 2-aminoethylphosphonate ABC transporter permease subunit, partial [Ramlibacter sp.]
MHGPLVGVDPAQVLRMSRPVKLRIHWTERLAQLGLVAIALLLGVAMVAPLFAILAKAVESPEGSGLGAFAAYLASPALLTSLWHSVWVSVLVTLVVVPLAFGFAYALTRSCMPAKGLFRTISLLPLLAPSLLSAISIIYWFGNQGVAKAFWLSLGFPGIYGASGIVLAECFATFPHVLMILVTALRLADARLYEAA